MEPVLLTAAFSLIPWNNPRNWVYQLFTTYLGYAVNKLKGGGVCRQAGKLAKHGVVVVGILRKNPLAHKTQSIFKQVQDQARGKGKGLAWDDGPWSSPHSPFIML